jgi:hypothetical protein
MEDVRLTLAVPTQWGEWRPIYHVPRPDHDLITMCNVLSEKAGAGTIGFPGSTTYPTTQMIQLQLPRSLTLPQITFPE